MAIVQALCTSFKREILVAEHDLSLAGHTIRAALYTSSATLGAATTAYSATNEVVGAGYTAGGAALTNVTPVTSGTSAFADFADVSWAASTITARGALIYNDTHAGNAAICVLDFGSDKTTSNQTFTLVFPSADATNAIVRIS